MTLLFAASSSVLARRWSCICAGPGLLARPAPARATSDDLAAARQKLDRRPRQRRTRPRPRSPPPTTSSRRPRATIAKLEDSIAATKAHAAGAARVSPAQRAVYAYTHPGNALEALVDATDAVDAARRQQLLDQANQTDNDVVKKLAAVNDAAQEPAGRPRAAGAAAAGADQRPARRQARGAAGQPGRDVEQAVTDLQTRLDAEIAIAAVRRRGQRKARARGREAPRSPRSRRISDRPGPGQIVASPVPGPFPCPVLGAAYSDDYGGPSGHPGIDMFVPDRHHGGRGEGGHRDASCPNEGAGGNAAYLERPTTATPTTTRTSRSSSVGRGPSPRARSSASPA